MTLNEHTSNGEPATLDAEPAPVLGSDHELVIEDSLVEEVSIDGMCGVY